MARSSFTSSIDIGFKTLLYNRFASYLGIDTQDLSTTAEKINRGIIQVPKGIAKRAIAEKRGETFLEFINFWRTGTSFSWDRNRTVLSRRGVNAAHTDSGKTGIRTVKAIPVDIRYNVWFWSEKLDKIYECIESYLLWEHDYRRIDITYDDSYTISPELHFGDIVDESTVDEKYDRGVIYCYKMPVKLDAWVPTGTTSTGVIHKIVLTLYDKDEISDYSTIVVDDSSFDADLEEALRMSQRKIYGILDVDTATKVFTVPGDRTSDFSVGQTIFVKGSTSNDGNYTTTSVSLVNNDTEIAVSESIASSTVDGVIEI